MKRKKTWLPYNKVLHCSSNQHESQCTKNNLPIRSLSPRWVGSWVHKVKISSLSGDKTIYHWYILRQWIALKVFSDWLLKLQISFAIHLQATHTGFAPENILTVAGLKETKSSFCVILSHCFSFHQNKYSLPCWWLVLDIYLTTSWLSKYPPLATPTLVNSF